MKSNALRNAISIALFAAVSSTAAVAGANDTSPVTSGGEQSPPSADTALHLPAGPLSAALDALARQAGLHLQWSSSLVAGRQVPAVNGVLHWRAALDQLLQGTGLAYRQDDSGSIVISPIASNAAETGASVASKDRQATALETLTVTGTRIRGGSTPSPVVTINNKRMQEEGFRDLGEVVRSIPQNFSGGQNPGVARGATQGAGGPANANLTGASSLNLRGLGPDATLTLLNGRRMSYGGYIQAVDIGAIPIEAVERIEIVPDGASAIYGSDAVGGVANVILKRDMDGVSVGARYAHATDGGMTTRDYSVTAGTTWSSGGVIVAYKDVSVDSVRADQRRYTRAMLSPTTIYPASHLKSALVSLHQSLGEVAELRVDALKTRRSQDYAYYYASTAASYNHLVPNNAALVVSPSIDFFLPGDWTLSLGGTRGDDNLDNLNLGVTVATGASAPRIHECTCNKLSSYEASAEGPLFALPAGDVRLAVGTGYRRNEFRYLNHLTGVSVIDTKEGSRFSYAEAAVPLMGNGDGMQARHRLELTAAVRNEDYDSFGSVTTPKLGLIYAPGTDFTVKASWGRSFKAPTLYQMHAPRLAQLVTVASLGATSPNPSATAMLLGGGNPDLSAERAVTKTASVAFHPEAVPGLEAELTWFQVGYRGRVVQPISNWTRPLVDPTYAQFIQRSPSPAVLSELLASVQNFFNTSGLPYNPANVEAVLRSGYTNVAEQKIDGLDLSGTYTVPTAVGQLTLRGAVSWLNSTQKTSPLAPEFDVAGTLFSPARVNGRLGAVWNRDALSFSVFGNYRSGVLDTGAGRRTSSFTTFDANVHYAPKLQTGVLSGMELSVGVQNLFNREPPLHMPASRDQAPYDSTNYSALGRILSASVSWTF